MMDVKNLHMHIVYTSILVYEGIYNRMSPWQLFKQCQWKTVLECD
jgi:hypothetical protein